MFKIIFRYGLALSLALSVAGYFHANAFGFAESKQERITEKQVHYQAESDRSQNQEVVFIEIDEKEEEESERSSLKRNSCSSLFVANFSNYFLAFNHSAQTLADFHFNLLPYAQPTYLLLRVFRL